MGVYLLVGLRVVALDDLADGVALLARHTPGHPDIVAVLDSGHSHPRHAHRPDLRPGTGFRVEPLH